MVLDLPQIVSTPMVPLLTGIAWALIHFFWEGLLIGAVSVLALIILRNAKPQSRYLFCFIALLSCLVLPVIYVLNAFFFDEAMPPSMQFVVVQLFGVSFSSDLSLLIPQVNTYVYWIIVPWMLGVVILLARLLNGLLSLGEYSSPNAYQTDSVWQNNLNRLATNFLLKRTVVLRMVEGLPSPITLGFLKPIILLPATLLSGMPTHFIEALLAHELAHIKRYDYLLNLIQRFIEAVLFFHPVVWWLSRIIREEREQIADEIAANYLGEARGLALALQQLDQLQYSSANLVQAANGGALKTRIRRLVYPELAGKERRWITTWVSVGVLLCTLYICVQWVSDRARAAHQPLQSNSGTPAQLDFMQCRPEYPQSSLKNSEEGKVTLDILIGKDDRVHAAKILQSSGYQGLDQAVVTSLLECKLGAKAALVKNEKVDAWLRIAYIWKLE